MDQILLGTALAAALASFGWFGWRETARGRTHRAFTSGMKLSTAAYVPVDVKAPIVKTGQWLPPSAQSRGPAWIYDVFTPPEIYYDSRARQFTVTPPNDPAGTNGLATPPGLELVAVKREPFRLQLVGYVGGEGNYLGTFENLLTSEVFLAGPGRPVPALDLMITDFTVQRRPVQIPDSMTSNQWVATALVRDERTGTSTTLTAGERSYTGELRVVLADEEDDDKTLHELRQGEEFQSAGHSYKIEQLQLEPPTAELTQTSSPLAQPVRLSLPPKILRGPAAENSAN